MAEEAQDSPQFSEGLFVINLDSSGMPMPLLVPFRHELEGFSVFRSRRLEDGRERYRLHLGYFDTQRHAEEALAVVRKYYAAAFISSAPGEKLGSLEDTLAAEFHLVRTAYARVVKPKEFPGNLPKFEPPALAPPVPVTTKVVGANVFRQATPQDMGYEAPSRKPEKQRYAVQLQWSVAPIISASIPRLAIFDAYSLYTVREQREGEPQYGLRLGFFVSTDSARQVAEYVRSDFATASVIPVSGREYTRALEAARARALKAVESGDLKVAPRPDHATTQRTRD